LWKEGFKGPPCFNGRIITLQNFILKRQGIESELFFRARMEMDDLAVRVEEMMYHCAQENELDGIPSLEQVKEFVRKRGGEIRVEDVEKVYKRAVAFFVL